MACIVNWPPPASSSCPSGVLARLKVKACLVFWAVTRPQQADRMPSKGGEGKKRKGKSSVTAAYKGPWCAEVSRRDCRRRNYR